MGEEIIRENTNDFAFGIKAQKLKNNWNEISYEISKLPTAEELKEFLFGYRRKINIRRYRHR